MRITKFEHACLLVDESGKSLIIDPGSFTTPPTEATNVVAVVITHEHVDHWSVDQVERLTDRFPDIPVLAPQGVADAAADASFPVTVVQPGDTIIAEPFTLRFFGGRHEPIHSSLPIVDNVGVLVNDTLYYPGDSYDVPEGVEVDLLAAPASGPWLRVGDAMDFILEVAPKRVIPVHDILLTRVGKDIVYPRLAAATEQHGGEFIALEPGETVDA